MLYHGKNFSNVETLFRRGYNNIKYNEKIGWGSESQKHLKP